MKEIKFSEMDRMIDLCVSLEDTGGCSVYIDTYGGPDSPSCGIELTPEQFKELRDWMAGGGQ